MALIPNIGPRGQAQRLRLGLTALGVAALFAAADLFFDVDRGWRALVFVPLWIAGLGVFQARDKT